jgi:hypothetical protein
MSVWANTRGVPGQAAGADVAMGPGAVFIVYGPARQHKLLPTCEQISSFLLPCISAASASFSTAIRSVELELAD